MTPLSATPLATQYSFLSQWDFCMLENENAKKWAKHQPNWHWQSFFVILFCPMISEFICLFMVSFFSLKKLHFHDIWYPSNLLDYDEKQKLKLQQFQLTFDSLRQAQSLGLVWKKVLFPSSPWNIGKKSWIYQSFWDIILKSRSQS